LSHQLAVSRLALIIWDESIYLSSPPFPF